MSEKIEIEVTSGGSTDAEIKKAKALAAELKNAANNADLASRIASKVPSMASSGKSDKIQQYDEFRGSQGTGAAARDFAKQASGLGGLVHVYATFAANIFAVSAAFEALSKAVDTSNMAKGLDQLGASAGRNLNSIAKQMVNVAEGAVSMRAAMQATAQASAANISGTNILKLTQIAKNASQALGRDMPEALDRLIRGTQKIEPELLDELGIMVKVKEANENYARSLGKTVSSLTDAERRQSFLNEVIAQGEKKFKDINIESNPYSKLSASLANATQSGLELVNKVLTPIAKLLAESPTGLAVAMGAVAVALLKQALPALGAFKEQIDDLAKQQRMAAVTKALDAEAARKAGYAKAAKMAEEAADKEVAAVGIAEDKIAAIREKSKFRKGTVASRLMETSIQDITEKDILKLEKNAANLRARGLKESADAHAEYANSLRAHKKAEEELAKTVKEGTDAILKRANATTTVGQNQIIADRALLKATSSEIVSKATQTGSSTGFLSALKEAKESIAEARKGKTIETGREIESIDKLGNSVKIMETVTVPAMGRINASWTYLKAGIGAATGAITTFMSAVGPWLAIIGMAVAAFGLLFDWLSANSKEMDKFSNSVENLTSNVELVGKTIDLIAKKPFAEQFSAETIHSKAGALSELSTSLTDVLDSLKKADNAANGFDRFIDGIKTLWGGDLKSKATKGIAEAVTSALKVTTGTAKEQLEKDLKGVLGDVELTTAGVTSALNKVDTENFIAKFTEVEERVKKATTAVSASDNALKSLETALSSVGLAADNMILSLKPTDTTFKFAESVIQGSNAMAKALKEPETAIQSLAAVLKDSRSMMQLSDTARKDAPALKAEVDSRIRDIGQAQKQVAELNEKLKNAKKDREDLFKNGGGESGAFTIGPALEASDELIKRITSEIAAAENAVANKRVKANEFAAEKLKEVMMSSSEYGAKVLEIALKQGAEQGALLISKAAIAGMTGPGTAELQYQLTMREIGIQERNIKLNLDMLTSQASLEVALEELAAVVASDTAKREKRLDEEKLASMPNKNSPEAKSLKDSIAAADKKITNFSSSINKLQEQKALFDVVLSAKSTKERKDILAGAANDYRASNSADGLANVANIQLKIAPMESALGLEERKKEAALITKKLSEYQEIAQMETAIANKTISEADSQLKIVSLLQASSIYYTKELDARKISLEAAKNQAEIEKENIAYKQISLATKLAEANQPSNAETKAAFAKKREFEELQHKTKIANITAAGIQTEMTLRAEADARALAEATRLMEIKTTIKSNADAVSKAEAEVAAARLSQAQQLGTISAETAAQVTESLGKEQAMRDYMAAKAKADSDAEIAKRKAEDAYSQSLGTLLKTEGPVDTTQLDTQKANKLKEIDDIQKSYNDKAKAEYDTKLAVLGITKTTTIELDKQNKVAKLMEGIGNSLTKVFGKVGTEIGNIGKTLYKSAKDTADIEERRKAAISKIGENDIDRVKKVNEIDQKYARETADVKLQAAADVAGSAAELFDQQSNAAKALHTIQKGFHILKLAMDIEAMASDWAVTANSVAADGVKTTASTAAGAAKIFSQMGIYGFAGVAAMLALMSTLGGKRGGGGFVPSSQQLKDTQGTGQRYDANGKLVDTGFGVLGDSSAKSESIQKSLDFIKQYTFEETEYSNKMLTALQSLTIGVNGISRGVARTGGTLSGTGFGTLEGFKAGGLGSIPIVGKLLGGIFGGGSTTTITGSGIKASGTVGSFASGNTGVNQYETGTTVTKGGWFSSDKTNPYYNQKAVTDEAFNKAIMDSFKGISDTLVAAGAAIGLDSKQLADQIAQIPVDLSVETRGLKGSEISDAISAVLSNTADMVASKVLDLVKPFQQLGEGLAETAMRVGRTSQVIDLQLNAIGKTFGSVGLSSLNARMSLIELSGGLDQFMSDSNFFKDNFLTEAQKLAPVQKAVTDEMARLGYSTVTTREQFRDLVLSLDLSTESGRATYTSLMKVEKGFAAITPELQKTLTVAELLTARLDQAAKAIQLVGTKEQIAAYSRKQELAALDAALRPMQEWIYALEDEVEARDALKAAYDAESSARQTTIDNLKSSISTLSDFSKSLALGADSPLTPGQKYDTAKSSYEAIKSVLNSTTSSADEKTKALADLPSAITAFLDTSKVFYASSEQYQKDYADAQSTLALKIADSKAQLTIEQKMFDTQKSQLETMGLINSSVMSVKEAIDKLYTATLVSTSKGQAAGQLSTTSPDQMGTGPATSEAGSIYASSKSKFIESIVKGWYENHPYANKTPDTEGLAYWTSEIMAGKSVTDVKTAFSRSASLVSGKTPLIDIQAFAKGGYMEGLSLVGEQGPELVNFKNPGQVYSNAQSSNLMGTLVESITEELVLLRKQVQVLEEANRRNTEALIRANYDANERAANRVSEAVVDAAETDNWNSNRNVLKLN